MRKKNEPDRVAETFQSAAVAVILAGAAFLRRAYSRWRQQRAANAMHDALHRLDDRTLHDLGFHRSEIESVAAEATGEAVRTRAAIFWP